MKLRIENYNTIQSIELEIGKNTFIYGSNEQMKFDLVQAFVGYMNKGKWSTLDKDSNIQPKVYLEGHPLDLSTYELIHIPGVLDLQNELKLSASSILKKYILKIIEILIQTSNEITTVQYLLSDFIEDELNLQDCSMLKMNMTTIAEKEVASFLKPAIYSGDNEVSLKSMNYYDFMNTLLEYIFIYMRLSTKRKILLYSNFGYGLNQSEFTLIHKKIMEKSSDISIFIPIKDLNTDEQKQINFIQSTGCFKLDDEEDLLHNIYDIYPIYIEKHALKNRYYKVLENYNFVNLINKDMVIDIYDNFEDNWILIEYFKRIKMDHKVNFILNPLNEQKPFYCCLKDVYGQ